MGRLEEASAPEEVEGEPFLASDPNRGENPKFLPLEVGVGGG